ncbi:hypothetical protein [Aequorivita capsosiphonis]|uniref:hypothetical protein n=1 Tax=Aequorivita capsosiphonis TaxID=487317 RepID=UPI0004281F0B|nr:hypothetical protein [Aequorivita capsosiphonis]
MKKFILIALIASVGMAFTIKNTSGLKVLILNKLKEYTTENYPEKIYIQTDKPYYTAGENIWFNTYLINGVTHTKSDKSKIVYVELINEKDKIIAMRKLFVESLSVQGDFKLPTGLQEGNYLLRAYTNYMRNQPRDYFFKKELPVFSLNSENAGDSSDKNPKTEENLVLPDIGFYPEGGYLVAGLNNKVAVKIKDADLNSGSISGIIEDTEGNKITEFKTQEFGLDSFYIKPEAGKEYRAVISSKEEHILYSLPNPLLEGYVLNTVLTEKDLVINVTTNQKDGLKNTLIIGQQRGLAAFDYLFDKNTNTSVLKIPKEQLIAGVLDIVLFNQSEKPVAERLVYINKDEDISVSVNKTNGFKTSLRDRVNLEIEVKEKSGRLVSGTFSLSITDTDLIKPNPNSENIKTYLLLSSDLRGEIKSPNYFFINDDTIKKDQQLDLIMLTHGWSRFTWQEFLENRTTQEFKPEDGIYISGNTLNSKSPFQNKISETKLTFRKKGFYQEAKKTDNYGHFMYGPFIFQDTIDVFLQAGKDLTSENPDFSDTNIVLDKPKEKPTIIPDRIASTFEFENDIANVQVYKKKSKSNIFRDFEFNDDIEKLDEVLLKGKLETEEDKKEIKRDKRTRSFEPSHRIVVSEMGEMGASSFMDLIINVPGIRTGRATLDQKKDPFDKILSIEEVEINLRGMKPTIYLDDVEVELKAARSVQPADIDFIDIRNTGHSSAAYGLKAQGIIAIYTKQGSRNKTNITDKKPGSINFKSEGFYSAREFYAPDYSLVDRNRSKIDKRSTLFWKPNVKTQGYKNAEVTFYTSDEKGTYQIKIEGITDKGVPIHATSFLEVE